MSKLNHKLEQLGIISCDRLETYYPRVRDREDIAVLRDPKTEVIVLSASNHVSQTYYVERKEIEHIAVHDSKVITPRLQDNIRRAAEFGHYIRGNRWLDFGCGIGGMLDELSSGASWAAGLEPNQDRALITTNKGHQVVGSLSDLEDESLDIVTMFHVLEHLTDPVGILTSLRRVLRPGGRLIIEVPHARDALFTLYDCDAFKRFTFWSEHLVLHTRQSLAILLSAAGYHETEIIGYQRYPLANHLHWLAKGLGGGHVKWKYLSGSQLDLSYSNSLTRIDRSDTLIATAVKEK